MSDEPLLQLLRELQARDYEFQAVTPATHARVLSRPFNARPDLRDIFGWNRPFEAGDLDDRLLTLLRAADALESDGPLLRSKLRVASLDRTLFLHSSFPTDDRDSVFFGPDTYRFARFVRDQLGRLPIPTWVVDMGSGSGAGGIIVARSSGARVTLVDVNAQALRLGRINAAHAGAPLETVLGPTMPEGADLVIANPPYIMDAAKRTYRDGGQLLGGGVALDWVVQALRNMTPGGTMLLYTGAAYQDGEAPLLRALERTCGDAGAHLAIEEVDSDVFGEELDCPAYAQVERIAAIGVVIGKANG